MTSQLTLYPSLLSVAVINSMTQSNLWMKGFVSPSKLQPISEENQGKHSRQGLKQIPAANAVPWYLLPCKRKERWAVFLLGSRLTG